MSLPELLLILFQLMVLFTFVIPLIASIGHVIWLVFLEIIISRRR
jgi:hypothetical protein